MQSTAKTLSNKLNARDLIHVGIYTALYFVIILIFAMLGMIPIFMPLLVVLDPFFCGIPFMLFLTKVKKPGMIFIMAMIMGFMMFVTGMGPWPIATAAVAGIFAELIYRKGNYASSKLAILSYAVFGLWMLGNYIQLFTDYEAYFATRQSFGQEYIEALSALMPLWMAPVLAIACFIFGLLGGFLGTKALNKHFKKAGIV